MATEIAHYLLNDNAANTTVVDAKGSYNGVAARNTTLFSTAGKLGPDASHQALTFNGTTDLVTVTGDLIGTGSVSISFWFRATGLGGGDAGRVIDNGQFLIRFSTLGVSVGSAGIGTVISASANTNTTYHCEIIRLAGGVTAIWLNGVLVAAGATGTPAAGGNTIIGNRAAVDRGFAGWLDDLRICSDVFTPEQQAFIYQLGNGTEIALGSPAIGAGFSRLAMGV